MIDKQAENDKPIEIYCPICGYASYINVPDASLDGLSRDEKMAKIREMQRGDHPAYTCDGCDSPDQTAGIMEIR